MDVVNVDMKLVALREDAENELAEQHKDRRRDMTEKKILPQVEEALLLVLPINKCKI